MNIWVRRGLAGLATGAAITAGALASAGAASANPHHQGWDGHHYANDWKGDRGCDKGGDWHHAKWNAWFDGHHWQWNWH